MKEQRLLLVVVGGCEVGQIKEGLKVLHLS